MAGDNLARVRAYEPELQRPEAPKITHKDNPRLKKAEIRRKCIRRMSVGILTFALMGAFIYGKVELSRITNEQSELVATLAQLQDNNRSLESELEAKTSLVKVEDYAENELGLVILDKTQIEYVEIENEDVIEVIEKEDDGLFASIKKWFDEVLEYIGI